MLPPEPTTNPLLAATLWLKPGPELVDVLAGEGMLGIEDEVFVTLNETSKNMLTMRV